MNRLFKIGLLLLIIVPASSLAQQADITGLWKGTMYNDTTQKYYRYEVGISKEKKGYSGFSHTWFIIGDTQYFGVKKVKIEISKDGKILIEDNGLIAHNYPIPPNKGVRQLNVLTLDNSEKTMVLSGPFSTNRTKEYHSLTGAIYLERKNDYWQSSLVPHLQELGKEEELSFVKDDKDALAGEVAKAKAKLSAEEQFKKDEIAKNEKMLAEKQRQQTEQAQREEAEKIKTEKAITKAAEQKQQAIAKQEQKEKAAQLRIEQEQTKEKEKEEKRLAKQTAEAQRIAQKAIAKEIPAKTTTVPPRLNLNTSPAADIKNRATVLQQTVAFSSDSLQLSLYDNGEIDGDTVSVVMNGELIFSKQGLSTTAAKKTIYIPHSTNEVELIMYAETLGTIPPNTGLLVVKDGAQIYELRFSGDYQKNASIVFKRKK